VSCPPPALPSAVAEDTGHERAEGGFLSELLSAEPQGLVSSYCAVSCEAVDWIQHVLDTSFFMALHVLG